MTCVNSLQSGLTPGFLIGGAHLGWVTLVMTGEAN